MLFIGANLAQARLDDFWRQPSVYALAAAKMIFFPLVMMGVLYFTNLGSSMVSQVAVLQAAMPSGVLVAILLERFDKDSLFATRGIIVTTLLSLITLPLISYLIEQLF